MLFNLRKKYYTMKLLAYQFNVNDFPETLDCFNIENPSEEIIMKDLIMLNELSSHPVFKQQLIGYDGKKYVDNISNKE